MKIQNPARKGAIALVIGLVPLGVALTEVLPEVLPGRAEADSGATVAGEPAPAPPRWVLTGALTGSATGVRVSLRPAQEELWEAHIDDAGIFSFDGIPAGHYFIWIEDPATETTLRYLVALEGELEKSLIVDATSSAISAVSYRVAAKSPAAERSAP